MLQRIKSLVASLRAGADAAIQSERHLRQLVQIELQKSLSGSPRFQEPLRLLASGHKVYSQGAEDGMLAEIYNRIGTTSRRFIEFGVENGLECNSALLLLQGWNGAWIDGSAANAASARSTYRDYPLEVVNSFITAENADEMITRLAGGQELDLLSIDIDSNDYWIWKEIQGTKPRVVVIEYNATLPATSRKTIAYNSSGWNGSNYFGASLGALEALGRSKGYSLVACSPAGVNAFFIRDDLVADKFCAPFTAANHYEPPRYGLAGPSGHPAGNGTWVEV